MKNTIIIAIASIAFLLGGPAAAQDNQNTTENTQPQVVSVEDARTLKQVKDAEPRYERGRSKLEQKHEASRERDRSEPVLIVADF